MEFDERQREAIFAPIDKSIIVKAAAGTGKTTVLVERIAYLLENGVEPGEILAITYTNKAADNMKRRVYGKLRINLTNIGTIHSVLEKWIGNRLERKRKYIEVIDKEDMDKLIHRCKGELGFYKCKKAISEYKTRVNLDEGFKDVLCDGVYCKYQEKLENCGKIDFDDILGKTWELVSRDIGFLEEIRNRYRVILIDEAQDLSEIQYEIFRKIIEEGNICVFVVGDPNQCIFKFDRAKDNIFEEIEEFLVSKGIIPVKVTLCVNYRSDKSIVNFANKERRNQKLDSSYSYSGEVGEIIRNKSLEDLIGILGKEKDLGRWAILCRSLKNKDVLKLTKALFEKNIPARMTKFPVKDENKATIRIITNLLYICYFDSEKPLLDILYLFKDKSSKEIYGLHREFKGNCTFLQYLLREGCKECEYINRFIRRIREARKCTGGSIKDLYREHIASIFEEYFDKGGESIEFFIDGLMAIQRHEGLSNEELVANIDFFMDPGNSETEKMVNRGNQLIISTVHKAKGLEWDNVIVIEKNLGSKKEDENIPYVAYTRAKHKLYLVK